MVCLHDRTTVGARIQVLVDRLDLRRTGTKYVVGGTAALGPSRRRAPSVSYMCLQREREGPSTAWQRFSELHSGLCTCKDVYNACVSARRGSRVGIREQPPLHRVSPAPSVERAMNHACARWRGLNNRQLTTQTPLLLPADAGGRAARLIIVWRRMAAEQGQTADHMKPPLCSWLTRAAARPGCLWMEMTGRRVGSIGGP